MYILKVGYPNQDNWLFRLIEEHDITFNINRIYTTRYVYSVIIILFYFLHLFLKTRCKSTMDNSERVCLNYICYNIYYYHLKDRLKADFMVISHYSFRHINLHSNMTVRSHLG